MIAGVESLRKYLKFLAMHEWKNEHMPSYRYFDLFDETKRLIWRKEGPVPQKHLFIQREKGV